MRQTSNAPSPDSLLLVTGGTGLVGSHVIERAVAQGWRVRALVRASSDQKFLRTLPVELIEGDFNDADSLVRASLQVTHCIHCGAKVGDWGPVIDYRRTNVAGLQLLIEALRTEGALKQFVHVSSLGVYPAVDHFGSDESEPVNRTGIDGYTVSKVEAEDVVLQAVCEQQFPAVIVRPGWIYGPRDRTVLPRLLENLRAGRVVYLGSGRQLLNQVYVGNLVDALFLALDRPDLRGGIFNLTDGHLVSRIEFMETICQLAGWPPPRKHMPLPLARLLTSLMEGTWRMLGRKEAPLLSQARIKFLGLHLDYSIDRACHQLGYAPRIPFAEGMRQTMDWAREEGLLEHPGNS